MLDRNWQALQNRSWMMRLHDCPQSPLHHAEGDVWTHTRLVVEALEQLPGYSRLCQQDQQVLWLAALLHDVAKPECTRQGPQGITSLGHSRRGAVLARKILWLEGLDWKLREQVAALVAFHMVPFWILERDDSLRQLLQVSLTARCDLLALLARADALGRQCADQQRLLDNVELFAELAREHDVVDKSWHFASDSSRVNYFRKGGDPHRLVYEDPKCTVTMMSGLPGSGKSTWVELQGGGLPQVSLDNLREELGVSPKDSAAPVIEAARQQARIYLRQGRDFIWDATNFSREIRSRCLPLFYDYAARVRIVVLETSAEELVRRNAVRRRRVPENVLERMLRRWEPPTVEEAQQVDWIVS